jgi:hypothetical protein
MLCDNHPGRDIFGFDAQKILNMAQILDRKCVCQGLHQTLEASAEELARTMSST